MCQCNGDPQFCDNRDTVNEEEEDGDIFLHSDVDDDDYDENEIA